MRWNLVVGLMTMALAIAPLTPATADYIFTTIDEPGANATQLRGINNSGQIVGFGNGGFLYSGSNFTNLTGFTFATGLNNNGQIVGNNSSQQGFLLNGGLYSQLPSGLDVAGINDSGQMVGFVNNGTGGFLLDGLLGTLTPVNPGAGTQVTAINNAGEMLATTNGGSFLLSGSSVIPIDVPGSTTTFAYGINNIGEIVGQYGTASGGQFGFLLSGGVYTTIAVPGPSGTTTTAFGINDLGEIVGTYVENGTANGFLATPDVSAVPEPAGFTMLLGAFAVGGLAWTKKRRRGAGRRERCSSSVRTLATRCGWLALGLAIAGTMMITSSRAEDNAKKVRDIDIKKIGDLEKLSPDAVRNIVVTKTVKEMTETDVAVATAVYSARLGTGVTFDRSKKAFVLAHEFHSRDTVAEAVLHIAEPNAPSFAGVLAKPRSAAVGSKEAGYRVVLKPEFSGIIPGDDQREGIAAAIKKDEETRPADQKTTDDEPDAAATKTPNSSDSKTMARLDKARETYAGAFEKFKADVRAALKRREDATRKGGQKGALSEIMNEQVVFESNGTLPQSVPLGAQIIALQRALVAMEKSYRQAIKEYTKAGQDALATETEAERGKLVDEAKSLLSPTVEGSPFQTNTVWTNGAWTLVVIARKGDKFEAAYKWAGQERAVTGTIKGMDVRWYGADVRSVKGAGGGHDHFGTISSDKDGDRIGFRWRGDDGKLNPFSVQRQVGR